MALHSLGINMIKWYHYILPGLLTILTRAPRERVDIIWSGKSWVHNVFRVYEMLFWRRAGIRCEATTAVDEEGNIYREFFTFEALFAHMETVVRSFFARTFVFVPFRIMLLRTNTGAVYPYLLAIAFDNATKSSTGSGSSITFAHTTTGSNTGLTSATTDTNAAISGTTYATIATTSINTRAVNGVYKQYLDFLFAPATGSNNVVVTGNAADEIRTKVATYTGVKQSNPTVSGTFGSNSNPGTLASTLTVGVTNSWMVGGYFDQGSAVADSLTNGTMRGLAATMSLGDSNAGLSTGSFTMTWNQTATGQPVQAISMLMEPFAAAAANTGNFLAFM